MYLVKTPQFIQSLFPNFIWKIPGNDAILYLTFDDGPIPNVTPWVLSLLKQFNAKATFFCVGENAATHPEIIQDILAGNHSIGNHTYHHLNGWRTSTKKYLENVEQCKQVLPPTKLFRPPYGKLKLSHYSLITSHYSLIMWDVLSKDYDQNISPEKCFRNVLSKTKAGSIVVFHDSLKAKKNLYYTLPKVLEHFTKEGFEFSSII